MWGINYQTLIMMLADQPRMINETQKPEEDPTGENTSKEELLAEAENLVEQFRSRQKDT